ncbi:MAG: hypothetical protein FWF22_08775 [Treponema sp.]|nr:hypothetical protein [Treponema sp.]
MLFSVRSNESKITFEISIEDWDGTYSCTETNDSDPAYFIVDKLVYTIGGKTVKLGNEGYSYIEVNNTTILVLNNGTDNVFEADNGDYVPGNAGLYALGDSSIFLFSDNDADQIFITSEGNYSEVTGVEGVDYVNIDNGKDKGILFPVDPDSDPSVPFYVDDNGPYTDSVEVDDLTKPNYDLITEQAFDLTIEFNSEAVKIGTGLIEFDGDEQLTVTYTLDTAFTTLLESFDSLSLSCNGVLAVSNQVFLGYNYNEDNDPMILDSVFALNVATPI